VNPLGILLILAAKAYQLLISPWKPPTCRYLPTCSQYFIDAVRILGPVRGTWRGVRRILRCHPWHEGGYDPVIPATTERRRGREGGDPDTGPEAPSDLETREAR